MVLLLLEVIISGNGATYIPSYRFLLPTNKFKFIIPRNFLILDKGAAGITLHND